MQSFAAVLATTAHRRRTSASGLSAPATARVAATNPSFERASRLASLVREQTRRSFVDRVTVAAPSGTDHQLAMRAYGSDAHVAYSVSERPLRWYVIDANAL